MRSVIAALPLLALTACGGASGPESVGSVAPPSGAGTGTGTTGGGASGGAGGGVTGGTGNAGTPAPGSTQAHFLDVTAETTFNTIGAFQSLSVNESGTFGFAGPTVYEANASTVRSPSGTINYSPRDGIFTINFQDAKAGISESVRFQDPAHRSATPGWGVPDVAGFNIIDAIGPSNRPASLTDTTDRGRRDTISFFYQRPGAQTNYVSLAGFVRNAYDLTSDPLIFKQQTVSLFERGAMVFGQETARSQVPISGTASYTGGLLATMTVNTNVDGRQPTYFQWITGESKIDLDFSKSTMALLLTGKVGEAIYAGQVLPTNVTAVPSGSTFSASGAGNISLTQSGGFTGVFSQVGFSNNNGTVVPIFDRINPGNNVAGANSIDGTFFGPNAVNVGGNFRVVGGVPDQRVDILGAFTGAKK